MINWLSQGKTITNLRLTIKEHLFTLIYEYGDWWWNVNGTSTSRQGKIKLRKPIFVFVLEITACTRRSKFWAVGKNFSVRSLTSVKIISSFYRTSHKPDGFLSWRISKIRDVGQEYRLRNSSRLKPCSGPISAIWNWTCWEPLFGVTNIILNNSTQNATERSLSSRFISLGSSIPPL